MITENPHITVQIKPKNCESDSTSSTVSVNSSWNVDATNGYDGRSSIQKQVRFSCPNDRSNEYNSGDSFWQSHIASNLETLYDYCRNDVREKRSRELECSNGSGFRKKVRMQLQKNITNKFGKNGSNGFAEFDGCRKTSSEQRPRKELRKSTFVDVNKNAQERHRVKIRDVSVTKEREKTPGEIPLAARENSRLAHREISRDKGPRNGFQKNGKCEAQRKHQNVGGPKAQLRKNTLVGEDVRKPTKKPDTKKVADKILTASIKHFAKYVEACRNEHVRAHETKNSVNKQNDGKYKIDGASNHYESTNTNSQETCGNTSEICSRNEISKDSGNAEENMWKVNQRRDDIEKIASQIRHDLEKSLIENPETTDGEFVKNIVGVDGILNDGSRFIKEGPTNGRFPINGTPTQKNSRIFSETKVMDNQRLIKDFRRRNSSYGEERVKPRTSGGDPVPQSSSALFSQKKVQDCPAPFQRLRSTRECNRRCRPDAWHGSNVWQIKDVRSCLSGRLDVGVEKKDTIGVQDVTRSGGNETSRIPTSKKYRGSVHELRPHTFKYAMDDPQKNYGAWKYGKNDRDIFWKNYINSAPKSNVEEIKHRIGVFGSKTDLGSLRRKESDAFGKGYREAFHKSVRDTNKSVGDGPEKSFWDFYRGNVWSSERKAPWDFMLNTSEYTRKDSRDKHRKNIRLSSEKESRCFSRNSSPQRKEFGDDSKKANFFEYLRSGDTSSSRILPSELRKNVSSDRKKSSGNNSHSHVTFESKNVHDHRKSFSVCSRKNEPASKNVGDVPSSIFGGHVSKLSRFERGKGTGPIASKSGWELGVSKHRRSASPKVGSTPTPAPSAALRFASFRARSPEDVYKWNLVNPHSSKSSHLQPHASGSLSRTSVRQDTPKVSTDVPRKHPYSADPQNGVRPKIQREHAWKAFGTFPWPAQSVHSAHNVRHNPSRHVLGESKSNTLVSPLSKHAESRYATVPVGLRRKERYPSRSHGHASSGHRTLKRSFEKTHFRSFDASEPLASHGDERLGERRRGDQGFAYSAHAARAADEKDVDASEEDTVQYVGEDVSDGGKFESTRRSLRATAWNSYPWVVRSTWGIRDEECSTEALKSTGVNKFSSEGLVSCNE